MKKSNMLLIVAGLGLAYWLYTRNSSPSPATPPSPTHGSIITASPFAPGWQDSWIPIIGAPLPSESVTSSNNNILDGGVYDPASAYAGGIAPNRVPLIPGTVSTPGNEVLNQFGQLMPAIQGSAPR